MDFEFIDTGRLWLRALRPETYNLLFTSLSEEQLRVFFGSATEEEWQEERKKYMDRLSMYRKSLLIFQLLEKTSGAVIGWCGFHTWYLNHFRAEIGYVLSGDEYKGKGFMSEVLPLVISYGFQNMGLKRIEAMVATDNIPSLKLLQSMGFQKEGLLREHYFVNERMEDSLVYSLLQREFQPRPLQVFSAPLQFINGLPANHLVSPTSEPA